MRIPSLAAAAALFALPLQAHDGVAIKDAYVRALGTGSGAAYFTVENHSDHSDRLISATAAPAERAELHSSGADSHGMMHMTPLADGIEIAPHGSHSLTQGGDHLMLFGLPKLEEGAQVTLTLTFERAGEVTVEAPVDNSR